MIWPHRDGLFWPHLVVMLAVVCEVGDGDGFVAVGAGSAWAEASAPGVAVGASLGAEVAGFALGAFVDRVGFGGER